MGLWVSSSHIIWNACNWCAAAEVKQCQRVMSLTRTTRSAGSTMTMITTHGSDGVSKLS
jgi:hypothetical protein